MSEEAVQSVDYHTLHSKLDFIFSTVVHDGEYPCSAASRNTRTRKAQERDREYYMYNGVHNSKNVVVSQENSPGNSRIAWSSLIRWVSGCGPEAKPADSLVGCNISLERITSRDTQRELAQLDNSEGRGGPRWKREWKRTYPYFFRIHGEALERYTARSGLLCSVVWGWHCRLHT